jgi:hypothetical protein
MLAMAIGLQSYMQNQVSAKMMTQIETAWLNKHWEQLQQPDSRTPRQVLCAYADDNDLTVASIDSQLDWNTWNYDSQEDPNADLDRE